MSSDFLNPKEKKSLELDVRRKVYLIVREFAGSHFREIERRSKLSTGSCQYHLDFLGRCGLVKLEKKDGNVRYFPKDFNSSNKEIMGFLRQKSVRDILLFVLTHENCSNDDILKKVRLSKSTLSFHLKKLEKSKIVDIIKKGRKTEINLLIGKKDLFNLLITYRGSFFDSLVDNVVEMWDIK